MTRVIALRGRLRVYRRTLRAGLVLRSAVSCIVALAIGWSAAACGSAKSTPDTRPAQPGAPAAPTLVVLITIDQFRADYLDRFGPQLTGGLARLTTGGSYFRNAHHDFAIPETAAGHATLLSGRFPRGTGILLNSSSVGDVASPVVGGTGPGASPRAFVGTTLVDWIRSRHPASRALAVSGKDRSAILPVGRSREQVYWYTGDGRFVTSSYYRAELPAWVNAFNARDLPRRRAGTTWHPLLPDSMYAERDAEPLERAGGDFTFPHRLPTDSAAAAARLIATPWMDEITLQFALAGVAALALGAGPHPDVLSISLSASDAIGHGYGPDSKEMHDQVLRLDRALGAFLDSLAGLRAPGRTLIALTADHGVARLPEIATRESGRTSWRVDAEALLAASRAEMRRAGVVGDALDLYLGILLVNRPALARARLDADSALAAFAARARQFPGIGRVDRMRDLRRADLATDAIARRWVHLLPESAGVEYVVTLSPGSIWSTSNVASHHSPHDYDTRVPLVLYGPSFPAGRSDAFVRVVDLAPTLARALGVRPSEVIDGVVLPAVPH